VTKRSARRKGVPAASSAIALARMRAVRLRDTGPELALRRELHRLGLRYRLHRLVVPGARRRPDIVFGPNRLAVFIDGCFWHGCPQHGTMAAANRQFWQDKIEINKRRDSDTNARLKAAGWRVIRIWEHEEPQIAARRVEKLLRRSHVH
jgi:DNA mismatch endonuclease, patch repair protein